MKKALVSLLLVVATALGATAATGAAPSVGASHHWCC